MFGFKRRKREREAAEKKEFESRQARWAWLQKHFPIGMSFEYLGGEYQVTSHSAFNPVDPWHAQYVTRPALIGTFVSRGSVTRDLELHADCVLQYIRDGECLGSKEHENAIDEEAFEREINLWLSTANDPRWREEHRRDFDDFEWAAAQPKGPPNYMVGDVVRFCVGGFGVIHEVKEPQSGWPAKYATSSVEGLPEHASRKGAWHYEGDFEERVGDSPLRTLKAS